MFTSTEYKPKMASEAVHLSRSLCVCLSRITHLGAYAAVELVEEQKPADSADIKRRELCAVFGGEDRAVVVEH